MADMKLLIVEDHKSLQDGIKSYILQHTEICHVSCTQDGKIGYKMLVEGDFDVMITDLNLPSLNGFQLIEQIKKHKSRLKIIVLTMHYNRAIVK